MNTHHRTLPVLGTRFDILSVHDHTLSEPLVDGELFCPATVEPGFGACPFTIG